MPELQAVLGFDVETDVGSWTPFYEGLLHGTPVVLDILRSAGISATFYFTGHSARTHPEAVRAVRDAGHEVGCHGLFHETVGDPLFDIPGDLPLLPEEVEHRLRTATDWVAEAGGVRPVSFRCPRLFGSTSVVNALDRLGYLTDASYPMYFFRRQLAPYHPARDDWTRTGEVRLLELPNFADLSMTPADPHGRDLDQWPVFRTEGAEALLAHVDHFLAYGRARGAPPFLCFYFHPWEFHTMPQGDIAYGEGSVRPNPLFVKNCGPHAAEQLGLLIEQLKDRGARFYQARQIAERGEGAS